MILTLNRKYFKYINLRANAFGSTIILLIDEANFLIKFFFSIKKYIYKLDFNSKKIFS